MIIAQAKQYVRQSQERLLLQPASEGLHQAYLQGYEVHDVNFASATCEKTVFTNTFGAIFTLAVHPDSNLLATDGHCSFGTGTQNRYSVTRLNSNICLTLLRPPGPYDGMNITGITEAQRAALKVLGAVEGADGLRLL